MVEFCYSLVWLAAWELLQTGAFTGITIFGLHQTNDYVTNDDETEDYTTILEARA